MKDDVLGEGKQRVLSMSYRVLFFLFFIFNAEGSSLAWLLTCWVAACSKRCDMDQRDMERDLRLRE
jgi:hypothetical protein